jgi:hypothetical protein
MQTEGWMGGLAGGTMLMWAALAVLVVVVVIYAKLFKKK